MTKYYQTEEEALEDLHSVFGDPREGETMPGWTLYHFVAGILTFVVPHRYKDDKPRILLRENEGLYWQESDT